MRRVVSHVSIVGNDGEGGGHHVVVPDTPGRPSLAGPSIGVVPTGFLRQTFARQVIVMAIVMCCYSIFSFHTQAPASSYYTHQYEQVMEVMREANQNKKDCWCNPSQTTSVLISLSQPWKTFESDHWFHISEYYLARSREIRPLVPANATVYIVTPTRVFFEQLTVFTTFLLVLSFTEGRSTVKVVPPAAVTKVVAGMVVLEPNAPAFTYNPRMPAVDRLYRTEAFQDVRFGCACARFLGEFGPAPVERGYWFGGDREVRAARGRMAVMCDHESGAAGGRPLPADEAAEAAAAAAPPKHKMVVYQRNRNRKFQRFEAMVEALEEQLGPEWELEVLLHSTDRHPCAMYESFHAADVFYTAHGFQTIAVLFMPPGGLVYEVFPYKYWKVGYAPLVREVGLTHHWAMSPPAGPVHRALLAAVPLSVCSLSYRCRLFARDADVVVGEAALRRVVVSSKQVVAAKAFVLQHVQNASLDHLLDKFEVLALKHQGGGSGGGGGGGGSNATAATDGGAVVVVDQDDGEGGGGRGRLRWANGTGNASAAVDPRRNEGPWINRRYHRDRARKPFDRIVQQQQRRAQKVSIQVA